MKLNVRELPERKYVLLLPSQPGESWPYLNACRIPLLPACHWASEWYSVQPFMKEKIHPKYVDAEIRCACGNTIKTRSTKPVIIVGICNACHPFYTGQQKFVDTAGRVDKFQQRMVKTQAAQAEAATRKKKR